MTEVTTPGSGEPASSSARNGRLGPAQRQTALAAMGSQTFDVVVVGGGVVGAGAALDAATRGLSVALLEARDWASGTSSRSSWRRYASAGSSSPGWRRT